MNMKISIIILTYKNFGNILNNLTSVINQNYSNYEIIISDDGSPDFDDGSIRELLDRKANCEYKILHHNNNIGTVKNYKMAIAQASGDIVMPLSQDDSLYDEHALSKINQHFLTCDNPFLFYRSIGEKTKAPSPKGNDYELIKNKNYSLIKKRLLVSNIVSGATLCMNRTKININELFDEDFFLLEDYPLVFRLAINNQFPCFMDDVLVVYGEEGISNNKKNTNPLLISDYQKMYKKYIIPNIILLNSKILKRYILRRFDLLTGKNCIIDKILLIFKYPDVAIANLCKIVQHFDDSIFYLLEKQR